MKDTNETRITVDHCVYMEEKRENERKLEILVSQEMKNMAMSHMIKGMISDYGRDTKVSKNIGSYTYHSAASSEILAHLDCDTIDNEASKRFLVSIYDLELAKYVFNEFKKMSKDSNEKE